MPKNGLLVCLLTMVLAGCAPAVVVRPLDNRAEKAPVDERIQGEWITPEVSESRVEDKIFLRWSVGSYDETDGYVVTLRSLAADKDKGDPDKEDTARSITFGSSRLRTSSSSLRNFKKNRWGPVKSRPRI